MNRPVFKIPTAINIVIFAGLMFGFFWPFRFAENAPFWERLMDAVHLPLFFGITCWLEIIWRRPGEALVTRLAKVVSVAMLAAGVVELLQPLTGRTDSLTDFQNGVFGAGSAGIAIWGWRERKSNCWRLATALLAAGLLVMALWPAVQEGMAVRWRQSHFPELGDFEEAVELRFWLPQGGNSEAFTSVKISGEQVAAGKHSLEIKAAAGSWSGVSFMAGGMNWSGRTKLAAEIYNPGAAFILGVRVDDDGDCSKYGRRFDSEWAINAGWNHLEFSASDLANGPRDRKLNLRNIHRLALFTDEDQPARVFYLDHVRLE